MKKLIPENDFPELQRDPESGVWYVRKEAKGKPPLFKSTREKRSKTKAARIAQQLLAEYLCLPKSELKNLFRFEDIAKQVLALKTIKSKLTQVSADLHINKHLMPFFRGYTIERVTEALWEQYIVEEHQKNPTRKLFNDRKHLIMIMRHAYKQGLIQRQLEFRNPDPHDVPGKEYTEDEMKALLAQAGPDLILQIELAYKNGMRRKEILSLSWVRVDLEEGYIHLRKEDTKIRRARTFPIHPDILPKLKAKFKDAESAYVFASPTNNSKPVLDNKTAWFACKRKAGVKGRFHDLVHTFMSWGIYKYNIPLTALCAISGKSIVVAEKRYIHARASNLRESLNLFRGLPWSEIDYANNLKELQ